MKQLWNSLRLAFSMYSVLPAGNVQKTKENMKYILCFVPWVGFIAALIIHEWAIVHPYLLNYDLLGPVICVMIPLLLSGASYMDGFFRTVDALCSHKPMEGKLEILQDSHGGYFAIITCVCYFFVIVGLWSEMPIDGWTVVACGFIISRSLYGLSILFFRHSVESKCSLYVPEGKTKGMVAALLITYIAVCGIYMIRTDAAEGIACLAGALLAFLYYCWVAFKHFGGITEDIASFFVHVCEILIPLIALFSYRNPFNIGSMY